MTFDQDYTLLVGSYSELDVLAHQPHSPLPGRGIVSMQWKRDGTLEETAVTDVLNPAVLIPHADGRSVYAIKETIADRGEITRYELGEKGELHEKDSKRANGRSTCYLALSPERDAAILISYWDAIIDVCTVAADGTLGDTHQSFRQFHRPEGEWRQVENREDHWGNRQVGPHAHCAHFWHDWVFIPDLGENAVFQYRYDKTKKTLARECWIDFEAGSGPRHMAMHPTLDICYISNELFNTVCVASLDASEPAENKPRLSPVQYVSTLENREQTSYVSEIRLSPDARFLYVSNRGDDSLAIFRVLDEGLLERIDIVPTGGRFPRHFAITPCGKGVLVANQDSSNLRIFERDVDTGRLVMLDEEVEMGSPNYIRFV
ncbi:MAG: hypothetical protein CSB44_10050 [Gammaproteobacteria bacterium]|nr:MAG: hypothetical protein CSB44_10050 [Gammaproteobacteria bacterium]